jgi:polysaccharide biosynthesis protein PslH
VRWASSITSSLSEHDRQQMLATDPGSAITVVPTGVDTQKYGVVPSASANPPRIVFTGSMDWEPNIYAVIYFVKAIFPRVCVEFPSAVLQIVGRTPHPRVQHLASPSVVVTGTVPSVGEYLRDPTLVVVPLRIGGGTRLKIFEAMAMRKAVVSTSIGTEGLDVKSGHNVILADDATSFAEAIILLLRDSALRRRYEDAAAKLAAQTIGQTSVSASPKYCKRSAADLPRAGNRAIPALPGNHERPGAGWKSESAVASVFARSRRSPCLRGGSSIVVRGELIADPPAPFDIRHRTDP